MITDCLQGELEVVTEAGTGLGRAKDAAADVTEKVPFLMLGERAGVGRTGAGEGQAYQLAVGRRSGKRDLPRRSSRRWVRRRGPHQDRPSPSWAGQLCTACSSPRHRQTGGLHAYARPPRPPPVPAGLDLPAAPLFKDALEKVIIPQVSLGGAFLC